MKKIVSLPRFDFRDPLVHQHGGIVFQPLVLATLVERRSHVHPLLERILNQAGTILCTLRRPDEKNHDDEYGKRNAKAAVLKNKD